MHEPQRNKRPTSPADQCAYNSNQPHDQKIRNNRSHARDVHIQKVVNRIEKHIQSRTGTDKEAFPPPVIVPFIQIAKHKYNTNFRAQNDLKENAQPQKRRRVINLILPHVAHQVHELNKYRRKRNEPREPHGVLQVQVPRLRFYSGGQSVSRARVVNGRSVYADE